MLRVRQAGRELLTAALHPVKGRPLVRNPAPPTPIAAYRLPRPWEQLYAGLSKLIAGGLQHPLYFRSA